MCNRGMRSQRSWASLLVPAGPQRDPSTSLSAWSELLWPWNYPITAGDGAPGRRAWRRGNRVLVKNERVHAGARGALFAALVAEAFPAGERSPSSTATRRPRSVFASLPLRSPAVHRFKPRSARKVMRAGRGEPHPPSPWSWAANHPLSSDPNAICAKPPKKILFGKCLNAGADLHRPGLRLAAARQRRRPS